MLRGPFEGWTERQLSLFLTVVGFLETGIVSSYESGELPLEEETAALDHLYWIKKIRADINNLMECPYNLLYAMWDWLNEQIPPDLDDPTDPEWGDHLTVLGALGNQVEIQNLTQTN